MEQQQAQLFAQVLDTMNQHSQALMQLLQRPESRKRSEIKFESFDGKGGDSAFMLWSVHVKMVLKSLDLEPPHSLYAIMGALRGDALNIAQTLEEKIPTFTSNESFLAALKNLFVSPAHKHKARADFERRVQNKGESVKVFHGLLLQLFNDSFEEAEREIRQSDLIDHFVAGLRSKQIRAKLHDLKIIDLYPQTYSKALDLVLFYQAEKERIELEEARLNMGGRLPPSESKRSEDGVEPMDIGAVKGKYGARPKWKSHPNKSDNKDGKSDKDEKSNSKPQNKAKKDDTCRSCGKMGHWAKDCYKNKAKAQSTKAQKEGKKGEAPQKPSQGN